LKKLLFLAGIILITASCSLKYEDVVEVESRVPELVFQDLLMTRYEDNKVTLEMSAEILEQYKKSDESFAQGVEFTAYDDDG